MAENVTDDPSIDARTWYAPTAEPKANQFAVRPSAPVVVLVSPRVQSEAAEDGTSQVTVMSGTESPALFRTSTLKADGRARPACPDWLSPLRITRDLLSSGPEGPSSPPQAARAVVAQRTSAAARSAFIDVAPCRQSRGSLPDRGSGPARTP